VGDIALLVAIAQRLCAIIENRAPIDAPGAACYGIILGLAPATPAIRCVGASLFQLLRVKLCLRWRYIGDKILNPSIFAGAPRVAANGVSCGMHYGVEHRDNNWIGHGSFLSGD
jgi:hypothetical protein